MCQDFESPLPLGEIHKFRTNLFAEHLGLPHPLFKDPGSESCARYIRESAWQNWKDYEASTSYAHSKFSKKFKWLKSSCILKQFDCVDCNKIDKYLLKNSLTI